MADCRVCGSGQEFPHAYHCHFCGIGIESDADLGVKYIIENKADRDVIVLYVCKRGVCVVWSGLRFQSDEGGDSGYYSLPARRVVFIEEAT